MARTDRQIERRDEGDIRPKEKSLLDVTIDKITTRNSKDLIYVRQTGPVTPEERPQPETAKPEPFKTEEQPIFEKPFLPTKPISHSPKISPSSIPNPSPSVTTNKPLDQNYPNYNSFLYSIPGYSAFQPLSYPGILPTQPPITQNETTNTDFKLFPTISKEDGNNKEPDAKVVEILTPKAENKDQTDFEDQFTPEIIPAVSVAEQNVTKSLSESKMSITSLAQGSGATVTIPTTIPSKDIKKKQTERFSLKTSIPISKIDMKCVGNPPENMLTTVAKKPAIFNPTLPNKVDVGTKVEIQSNIVIKSALQEPEAEKQVTPTPNSISTLINAAEAVNKNDLQFRKPEPKNDVINEIKDPPPVFTPTSTSISRPVFNPINLESGPANFPSKTPEQTFNDQKNQIVFIQNKNQNPKMLLTIQQQNPQVLLQRSNFESKNAQVPSRLSSQSKKNKEDVADNSAPSKVVALKRLHQENCDENDFENLITENQIYGNKIVVKEKSQGTLQEQDLKNKKTNDKNTETKNVVLQPNFLYLSNVQFPANLMMIKNNAKVNQNSEQKITKVAPNENKATNEASTMTNSNELNLQKNSKPQNISVNTVNKEIHVLKSSNNVLQTLSHKNSKQDLVFPASHQKVIMNSQIVYQVPMIVDADNKLNQPFINRDYPKFIGQNNKEFPKQFDQKSNEKLYIACPYQMDSKLQPKIVITNIRPKMAKVDEISSLDLYEKRKRMRRLKYLSNRDTKEQKTDFKKLPEKIDALRNTSIITPSKMKEEICKEFSNTKIKIDEGSSESESDYGEDDLAEYESIIKKYGVFNENENGKAEFLANFRLGTHENCKEKYLDRQERSLNKDLVASAYIAVNRIDILTKELTTNATSETRLTEIVTEEKWEEIDYGETLQVKQKFLTQLKLVQVNQQFKEGYERIWNEIMKERKRRNGIADSPQILNQPKLRALLEQKLELDPNGQLQILTEIKKSVNENNNLIKRKLDSLDQDVNGEGDSIHTLAEKNFSELNRLSKMADRSVKLITGQDTKKRDLNPGFDSENIQKPLLKIQQPFQNYPQINIPNISKIISLKSDSQVATQVTSQATSMDEPVNSAAGVEDDVRVKEFGCQVEEPLPWPGIEAALRSYREFDAARKREINECHRRNTALRVEGAHITRRASRDSDRARALLAERQHLANEEAAVRRSLQKLASAIETIRRY